MKNTAATPQALRLRRSAARKAKAALAATVVAAALAMPPLLAGLVAPPAHAETTFKVTTTNDSGAGSLRQAILDANDTAGADTINFAVPAALRDPTTGVATIKPQTELPIITEQVTINGYSQQDASPNTKAVGDDASLKIELDGTDAGDASGLNIDAQGSVVRGLVINRFSFAGVAFVGLEDADGSRLEGNFIGTDPSGTQDLGNAVNGVSMIENSNIVVGGTTPDKRNLISGNNGNGISVTGLGVGAAGNNKVQGNLIGTDKNGTANLGNDENGVLMASTSNNTVGGGSGAAANTIAFNGKDENASTGRDGVAILNGGTLGNRVLRNSIFSNGGLGIDLLGPNESKLTDVSAPNDALDIDSGPNDLQNKPSIGSAKTISGTTTVKGSLGSEASKSYTIEFYSNPSGNEGKKFLGTKSVTTGTDGKATFTFTPASAVTVGQTITATATNTTTGHPHDTSEFSAPRTVASS